MRTPDQPERPARMDFVRIANLVVFALLAAALLASIVLRESATPKADVAVRAVALACVVILAYFAIVLGRAGNRRLLPLLLTLIVLGELVLRAVGSLSLPPARDVDWREPRPYFMFGGPAGKAIMVPAQMGGSETDRLAHFNEQGFRIDGLVATPKPANELRIFVLGGSTVVLGAPLANTIPGIVEERLRTGGVTTAHVYNFGVVSFVSGQELALLLHRLVDLEPDLVVAYDGGNDMFQSWVYDPRPGYPFNFATWETALLEFAARSPTTPKTLADLADDSALLRALWSRTRRTVGQSLDEKRQIANYGTSGWKEAIVETYARNVAEMCRVTRAHNILFAAYFQPLLPYARELDNQQLAISGGEVKVSALREQRAAVPAAVARKMKSDEKGCRFADLSGLFEQESKRFWDIIHVDNLGNQVVGRRIAEDLLGWSELPRAH